ncbi:hypothetical protein BH20ACT5_BH20ACT5_01180 [soil metagenome]
MRGEDVLAAYVEAMGALAGDGPRELTVAYTAMHGIGADVLRSVFARAGFAPPVSVPEQDRPDPDFPTVAFPNPEEPGAMDLLLALASSIAADIAIAHDPDADRCAVAVGGRMLRGDEVGVLLGDYLLRSGARGTFAARIVSSSMLGALCTAADVPYAETLTGFKWIVRAPQQTGVPLSFGYEEALGYAVAPDLVRDKDGISAAMLLAALAAQLRAAGRTLLDRLDELAVEHGVYGTDQISVRVEDLSVIAATMARLRSNPPVTLLERSVRFVDLAPGADVVRLAGDGVRVIARPSGTEPKLKIYLEVVVPVTGSLAEARAVSAALLGRLRQELTMHGVASSVLPG